MNRPLRSQEFFYAIRENKSGSPEGSPFNNDAVTYIEHFYAFMPVSHPQSVQHILVLRVQNH